MDTGRTDHLGLSGEDRQLPVGADVALGVARVCWAGLQKRGRRKMKAEERRAVCVTQPTIS